MIIGGRAAGIKMSLVPPKARKLITSDKIILYGRSCKNTAGLVLSNDPFWDMLEKILTFSETFAQQYDVPFLQATNQDIAEDLRSSDFLAETSISSCLRYLQVAKLYLRYAESAKFVENNTLNLMRLTHLDDCSL